MARPQSKDYGKKQRDILRRKAAGDTLEQIAAALGMSKGYVRHYLPPAAGRCPACYRMHTQQPTKET